MRDYSKVSPKFWIGETGKKLRKAGPEAQIVAMYLMTSPHSNMLGLYYQPQMFMAHETGLGTEGTSKGLARAIEAGFCHYDEASEMVWVVEMAGYQIAEQLKPDDKRCIGIQNEYDALPENPYFQAFFDKYATAFNMKKARVSAIQTPSPIEAPSKPHRSQAQEQEQEQEHEQEQIPIGAASSAETRKARKQVVDDLPGFSEIQQYYPKRGGGQRWGDARRFYRQRLREGHTHEIILAGVQRYAEYTRDTGKERTEHVQQAATFLGSNKGFLEMWTSPRAPPDKKFLSAVERVKLANGTGAKSDERVVSEQRSQQGIHNLDMLGGDVREPANSGVRRLGS